MALKSTPHPKQHDEHVWAYIMQNYNPHWQEDKDNYFLGVQGDKPFMQRSLEAVMKNMSERTGNKYEVIRTS